MLKNNKEFDRNICFTFFEDYRKTAKEIEEDFGKEAVAEYYNSIIDYALYEIEPELKGTIKYLWHTTKTTIDKSIDRRASGFAREDIEMTERILKYKKDNPNATQRDIAHFTGASIGKVNKVLNNHSISYTNSDASTSSNTTSEHEHEHGSSIDEKKNIKKEKKKPRKLEEISDKEKAEIVKHFRAKTKTYTEMNIYYNLEYGCLSAESILSLEEELIIKNNKEKDLNKKKINQETLNIFELNKQEGDELCKYLSGHLWEEFSDTIGNFIGDFVEITQKSAKELLTFLRENELARNEVYKRNNNRDGDHRFIIDNNYRWNYYGDYLVAYINNPIDISNKVIEYEKNKRSEQRIWS